jgi:hypothetical protein
MIRVSQMRPILAAVGVLAVAAPAATAQAAGSYVVSACSPTTSAGAWQPVNTFPAALAQGNRCGGPAVGPPSTTEQGALFAEDVVGATSPIPPGAVAGWTFTAPAGTQIIAVSSYRSLATNTVDLDLQVGLFADGTAIDACRTPPGGFGCAETNNQGAVTETGLHASGLFFGVKCDPVGVAAVCTSGGTVHDAQADMYSVRVTLAESALPALTGVGGPLWGGGVVAGVVPVTFSASAPSGISTAAVQGVTGQVALQPQACDFSLAQPCPQLPTGQLSVDTSLLRDGPQTVTLVATDAAGNTGTAQSPSVVVDNNGPPAPANLTAGAIGPGSNVVNLAWSNPPAPPQPITGAQAQLCQASCGTAVAVSTAGSAQITAPGPGAYTVRLSLSDSAGKTGAAATSTVTVPAPKSGGGGGGGDGNPPAKDATVHTKIAATISGQRLRVSGTIASTVHGTVKVSWRSRRSGHTLGSGSRTVTIHNHRILLGFTLSQRARGGVTHVAVRSGSRIIGGALAHRP